MIFDYMATWTLHGWSLFCCTVATLGLVGAGIFAFLARSGKGIFRFLDHDQEPTVIVVNGGHYVAPPKPRRWTFGRYYLLFLAIFSGGPMLTLLILGANHAAWYAFDWIGANLWVLVLPAVGFLVVGAVAWLIRRDRSDRQEDAQLAALPAHVPEPAVAAQPLWSAPAVQGNWSDRA